MRQLSEKEKKVMEEKQMEAPFLNIYYLHEDDGIYCCRRCDSSLFDSSSKFHSGSGWPCFDCNVKDAIHVLYNDSSEKEECFCSSCKGFLGFRYVGEGLTSNNVRYNISSLSLRFKGR